MPDDLFSKNYFEIFDVAVAYNVDLDRVSSIYRDLQKAVHPDRFASGSEQERRIAMQQTSLINQAFQTLKDPVSRAQYLLGLKGIDMQNETDTTMDAEFLMEQMEFREAIAEVREQSDPIDALDKMLADSKQKITHLMDAFATQYAAEQLNDARETVRKMQFLFKAQKEITALTEQLENELM
jgi:molecular chaperone HscB